MVQDIIGNLSITEKYAFLNGVGWMNSTYDNSPGYYIGNIPGVPRLGVPSLNMQDAGQGFRTSDARMVGEVRLSRTVWTKGQKGSSRKLTQ